METIRAMNRMTSQSQTENNPTQPSQPKAMVEGRGEEAFNYQDLPEGMQYESSGKRKQRWEALRSKHGNEVMKRTIRRWQDQHDTRGLKDCWGFFLDECGPCIQ